MAKTTIITRAYNRLEYTVLCVRETHRLAGNANYEHIIIEQGSSDGTKDWLESMQKEHFYKIRVKYNDKNTGDAGGMKDGFDMIGDDCKYILQLDNDLMPLTPDFINKMEDIFDNDEKIGTLMLKRKGVNKMLQLNQLYKTYNDIRLYTMQKNHAMFFRVDLLKKINFWKANENIGWVKDVPDKVEKMKYLVLKTPDIKVMHIDTSSGQYKRYPIYNKIGNKTTKGSNYAIFSYKNL
jgi:GT2 family glycosyltransferase